MIDLTNKTILITGASSGIGRATAVLCARLGAEVIITGRNKTELNATQRLLSKNCKLFFADLSVETEIADLIKSLPAIDGVVHCAGIIKPYPIKFLKLKHITEIFNINFSSAALISSFLLSEKKLNASASIVFISSVSAGYPHVGGALYSSSKSAIESFARSFALENASKRIRANIIAPALVKTKMYEEAALSYTPEELKTISESYPLGIGAPEDIANAAAFLLSDASKWITGTTLKMDGGLLLNSKK
jgi:NAD(P)-dependent dehydrogenase (short-subunit alcohol dehydrogenase family)